MTAISAKTRMLLTLLMLKGIGPTALRKLTRIPFFEKEGIADLLTRQSRNAGASIDAAAISEAVAEADRQIDLAQAAGVRIISTTDSEYPSLMKKTKDDPQILFVKGKLAGEPRSRLRF